MAFDSRPGLAQPGLLELAALPAASGVTGTLALLDAADVVAIVGTNGLSGVMALLDAADVVAIAGSAPVTGTLALLDRPDVLAMVGAATATNIVIVKIAPFFTTDVITTAGYQLYHYVANVLTADGPHRTTGIDAIPNITNGYSVGLTAVLMSLDPDGGYRGMIVWDSGGGSPFYVADEVFVPWQRVTLDLTQVLTQGGTVGTALQAALAQGTGKWVMTPGSPGSLAIYLPDNVTILKTFTIDNTSAPTSRA